MSRKKALRILYFAVGIFSIAPICFILYLLVIEISVRMLNLDQRDGVRRDVELGQTKQTEKMDALRQALGTFFFPPDAVSFERIYINSKLSTEAKYTINSLGERISPFGKPAEDLVVFLGCSYTFGQYVNDSDTYPAQAQRILPNHEIHNFGVIGHGPHQAPSYLEQFIPRTLFQGKRSLVIYAFIDQHIEWVIGSSDYFRWHPPQGTPHWKLVHNNLVGDETFSRKMRRDPFLLGRYLWSQFIRGFRIINLVNPIFPLEIYSVEENWVLVSALLSRLKDLSSERGAQFAVLLWPENYGARSNLIPRLQAQRIQYMDYVDLFSGESDLQIPFDSHPNEKAYKIVANRLALDIPKIFSSEHSILN